MINIACHFALDDVLFMLLFPPSQICSQGNRDENWTTVHLATKFMPNMLHDVHTCKKTAGFVMQSAGSYSLYCIFAYQASTASSH